MMFIMHISALLAYSVLLGSTALLIWSLRNKGAGSSLGKTIGSIIFILSLLSILCIGYYGIKYWTQGNFETPASMSMGMQNEMMQKMMPMMMQQMMEHMGHKENMGKMNQMENMGQMGNMGMQKGEEHQSTPQ